MFSNQNTPSCQAQNFTGQSPALNKTSPFALGFQKVGQPTNSMFNSPNTSLLPNQPSTPSFFNSHNPSNPTTSLFPGSNFNMGMPSPAGNLPFSSQQNNSLLNNPTGSFGTSGSNLFGTGTQNSAVSQTTGFMSSFKNPSQSFNTAIPLGAGPGTTFGSKPATSMFGNPLFGAQPTNSLPSTGFGTFNQSIPGSGYNTAGKTGINPYGATNLLQQPNSFSLVSSAPSSFTSSFPGSSQTTMFGSNTTSNFGTSGLANKPLGSVVSTSSVLPSGFQSSFPTSTLAGFGSGFGNTSQLTSTMNTPGFSNAFSSTQANTAFNPSAMNQQTLASNTFGNSQSSGIFGSSLQNYGNVFTQPVSSQQNQNYTLGQFPGGNTGVQQSSSSFSQFSSGSAFGGPNSTTTTGFFNPNSTQFSSAANQLPSGISNLSHLLNTESDKVVEIFGYKSVATRFGPLEYFNTNYASPPDLQNVTDASLNACSGVSDQDIDMFANTSYDYDLKLGTNINSNNDAELRDCPMDTISRLRYSRYQSDVIACSSWDGSISAWRIDERLIQTPLCKVTVPGCIFDLDWLIGGTNIVMAGSSGSLYLLDVPSQRYTEFAKHMGPVKCLKSCGEYNSNLVVSGSYDGTVRLWDLRTKSVHSVIQAGAKVYDLDTCKNGLSFITSEKDLMVYRYTDFSKPYFQKRIDSGSFPLRCSSMTTFNSRKEGGYLIAIGTLGGRVSIIAQCNNAKYSLSFKHRDFNFKVSRMSQANLANTQHVHGVEFHPRSYVLALAGGDGCVSFWDIQKRNPVHGIKGFKYRTQRPAIYLRRCNEELNHPAPNPVFNSIF
ncbi:hypothetical protein MXB_2217 [Myxobolus squamalis]|nr:hypothetical protein MXB_2217 [Myxobolus squamalis]